MNINSISQKDAIIILARLAKEMAKSKKIITGTPEIPRTEIPRIWDIVSGMYIEMTIKDPPLSVVRKPTVTPGEIKFHNEMKEFLDTPINIVRKAPSPQPDHIRGEAENISIRTLKLLRDRIAFYVETIKALLEKYPHLWLYFLFLLGLLSFIIYLLRRKKLWSKIMDWFTRTDKNDLFEAYKNAKRLNRLPKPPIESLEEREAKKDGKLQAIRELLKKINKNHKKLDAIKKASRRQPPVTIPKPIEKQERKPEIIDLSVEKSTEEKVYENPWKKVEKSPE